MVSLWVVNEKIKGDGTDGTRFDLLPLNSPTVSALPSVPAIPSRRV